MNDKLIIAVIGFATLSIIGLAVWQQQKRLPELEAKRPPKQEQFTPPPGLGNDGKGSPLEFASLFGNLKPEKQQCFREKFGEERLSQILQNPTFVPSAEDNGIIGECLLAGATFEDSAATSPSPTTP